jgi:hypothetical protein
MRMVGYSLSVAFVVVGAMYFLLPGGSLPTFMPGYDAGSTHIHTMHAVAALTGAVIFLLFGLTRR